MQRKRHGCAHPVRTRGAQRTNPRPWTTASPIHALTISETGTCRPSASGAMFSDDSWGPVATDEDLRDGRRGEGAGAEGLGAGEGGLRGEGWGWGGLHKV